MICELQIFFKTETCSPFCMPKPDADLCICVDLLVDKKTVENQDWATRPPDHRGLQAAGPQAPAPTQAVGCGAPGLL